MAETTVSVTIPTGKGNPVIVILNNGVAQSFAAGQTYSVAPEVAAALKALTALDPQTSDAHNIPELPVPAAADEGKFLGVEEGVWIPKDVPSDLPEVTAEDNGKVLGVVDGEWALIELS